MVFINNASSLVRKITESRCSLIHVAFLTVLYFVVNKVLYSVNSLRILIFNFSNKKIERRKMKTESAILITIEYI